MNIPLRHVPARVAAQIVAQLYLPIGLGGGDDQHYLIYQDSAESVAARQAVDWIDVTRDTAPGGSKGTMIEGMTKLVEIVRSPGSPPREAIQECRAALNRAAAGPDLDAASRWAAAMLAGRLAAEQLFDYEAALLAYDEAARHASAGSVQMLATAWARAESLELGGDKQAARQEFERITREYAGHSGAQAVRRAKAALTAKGR